MESQRMIEEDRISNLPDHLIDLFLERLPVEDAVKTSILSKKWMYTWTKISSLVFDEHFSNKFAKNEAFISIITKVLILHQGCILKFHFHIPNINLDSFQEVDQWNDPYELPSYVFSCLELKMLILDNCSFKPPLEFEGFPNLEVLKLRNIDFGDNMCGTQINLPQLKCLFLHHSTNVFNFNIKATKLKFLYVLNCPDAMLLRLLHSPCLTFFALYCTEPIEDDVRVERMTLASMLSHLPMIEQLDVNGLFFKVLLDEKIPRWLPHAVNSLKYLLMDFEVGDLDQLEGALCLLRNSPNLEFLMINMDWRWHSEEPQVISYDVGPASDHLESPNCLNSTLNRLQTVWIRLLDGSRPEMLFIKLLLAHSPSLNIFTIGLFEACDAQKRLDISQDVMRFPRASPKAEVALQES